MEASLWEFLKLFASVIGTVGAIVGFFIRKFDKRMEKYESEIAEMLKHQHESNIKVERMEVKFFYISEKLSEISNSISKLADK